MLPAVADAPISTRALNRALLARQGLLDRLELTTVEAVEAVGALQAQHWPAPPVALWSRVAGFELAGFHAALDRRQLLVGTLIRGTLHLVSARQQPVYAAVGNAGGANEWRRKTKTPQPWGDELRSALHTFAKGAARTPEQLHGFITERLGDADPAGADAAELATQRSVRWRAMYRGTIFVREPADGSWSGRTPAGYRAAPKPALKDAEAALDQAVRWYLAAFGPAAVDDASTWLGVRTPLVRAAVDRLGTELIRLPGPGGRALLDLPDAPRPDPDTATPVRFLPAFDNCLLAYAPKHRGRVVPAPYRSLVYAERNLQVLATFLVDGLVAGLWSAGARRRTATLQVRAAAKLTKQVRSEVAAEGEKLLRFLHPDATGFAVEFGS